MKLSFAFSFFSNGGWSALPLMCEEDCHEQPIIPNGYVVKPTVTVLLPGTVMHEYCSSDAGYFSATSMTQDDRVCAFGNWADVSLMCVQQCKPFPPQPSQYVVGLKEFLFISFLFVSVDCY